MTNREGTIQKLLDLDLNTDNELKHACASAGVDIKEAIKAAIALKLEEWLADPEEIEKRVKQDLMLAKLYRR